jgi:hypothetical protein
VEPSLRAGRRAGVSSARSRLMFALWPQTYVHSSWIELDVPGGDSRLGPWVADAFRPPGPDAGEAQRLAAHLLLDGVGASWQDGVASAWLPAWVHRSSASVRFGLSSLLASLLESMLRRAVSPAVCRHLDTLIGPDVRRVALVLAEHHALLQQSADLASPRRIARSSCVSHQAWERGCLLLGASILDAQVHPEEAAKGAIARLRLLFSAGTPLGANASFSKEPLRRLGELLDHPLLAESCDSYSTLIRGRP